MRYPPPLALMVVPVPVVVDRDGGGGRVDAVEAAYPSLVRRCAWCVAAAFGLTAGLVLRCHVGLGLAGVGTCLYGMMPRLVLELRLCIGTTGTPGGMPLPFSRVELRPHVMGMEGVLLFCTRCGRRHWYRHRLVWLIIMFSLGRRHPAIAFIG